MTNKVHDTHLMRLVFLDCEIFHLLKILNYENDMSLADVYFF